MENCWRKTYCTDFVGKDGNTIKSIAFNAVENDLCGYLLQKNNKIFNIAGKLSQMNGKGNQM